MSYTPTKIPYLDVTLNLRVLNIFPSVVWTYYELISGVWQPLSSFSSIKDAGRSALFSLRDTPLVALTVLEAFLHCSLYQSCITPLPPLELETSPWRWRWLSLRVREWCYPLHGTTSNEEFDERTGTCLRTIFSNPIRARGVPIIEAGKKKTSTEMERLALELESWLKVFSLSWKYHLHKRLDFRMAVVHAKFGHEAHNFPSVQSLWTPFRRSRVASDTLKPFKALSRL